MAQRVLYNNSGRADSITLQPSSVDLGNVTNDLQIPKSIVTAKGDIITATANATPVRQGIGNNGQIVVADSNLTNGLGYKDPSFRNWIMNGNMEVAQRGTSWTNPITNSYTIDRWQVFFVSDGGTIPNIICSQQLLTSGDLFNSFYYFRFNTDGAGASLGKGSNYQFANHIENGTRFLCGLNKKVTVSFYARSSISDRMIRLNLGQYYGSGGSPSVPENFQQFITLSSSWTKYTYTFTTNTLVGKTFGTNNDDYLIVAFFLQRGNVSGMETYSGSGNIDIAQVALYAGDVAYPFEPVPYDIELQRCMRFCQVFNQYHTMRSFLYSGNHLYFFYSLPVPLRINNATMTFYGTHNTDLKIYTINNVAQTGFTFAKNYARPDHISVVATKTSHGLTDAFFSIVTSSGSIVIDADF